MKSIFSKLIIYDVPSSSYILKLPNTIQEHNKGILRVSKTTIAFPKDQSDDNFEYLFQAITQTQLLIEKLTEIMPFSDIIHNQNIICLDELRGDIDYILPYLNLEHRKIIINTLSKSNIDDLSIYDLLVRLKLKGQDGEMLSKVIEGIVEKVKENIEILEYVISFLEMAQNDIKSLNMGFFVSNSLIEEL